MLTGPFKPGQTALAKRYEKSLSRYDVIPVSTPIAALAAQLRAQYRLKLPDAIQLATALDIGAAAFVTHDRDFSHVTGVDILRGDQDGAALAVHSHIAVGAVSAPPEN